MKPSKRNIDIFSKPIVSRSLESLDDEEVLVKMSTFIVPQEDDLLARYCVDVESNVRFPTLFDSYEVHGDSLRNNNLFMEQTKRDPLIKYSSSPSNELPDANTALCNSCQRDGSNKFWNLSKTDICLIGVVCNLCINVFIVYTLMNMKICQSGAT